MSTLSEPLSRDDVRVRYRATGSFGDDAVRACEATLSDEERARGTRFRFFADRRDFAAAHGLLRSTLSRYGRLPAGAWRFESNSYGKPSIVSAEAGGLTINLSHTRGLVACVVGRGVDVGIDVEPINAARPHRDIAGRFFSDVERRYLDTCTPQEFPCRFVELWTLKEAYIKALGTGLNCPLDRFSFTFEGDAGIRFDSGTEASHLYWQFALAAPLPGFRLAVAVRRVPIDRRYRIVLHNADVDTAAPTAWVRESTG